MNNKIPYKIYLEESEMPRQWYNVRADMKNKPAPILNPATMKPVTVEELTPIFCEELAKQELDDATPYFDIPQEIRDFYKMYRPSPLTRAYCLEKKLDTPAHIYYKFEGNNMFILRRYMSFVGCFRRKAAIINVKINPLINLPNNSVNPMKKGVIKAVRKRSVISCSGLLPYIWLIVSRIISRYLVSSSGCRE